MAFWLYIFASLLELINIILGMTGQPRRHLLQSGWSVFVSSKRLVAGDAFIFLRLVDFLQLRFYVHIFLIFFCSVSLFDIGLSPNP